MSASEIIKELPKLSEAERRAVLDKLRELAVRDEDVRLREQAADEQAAELDRLKEPAADYRAVDLRSRGLSEAQARDLRARLKTFAEDWVAPKRPSTMKTRRDDVVLVLFPNSDLRCAVEPSRSERDTMERPDERHGRLSREVAVGRGRPRYKADHAAFLVTAF